MKTQLTPHAEQLLRAIADRATTVEQILSAPARAPSAQAKLSREQLKAELLAITERCAGRPLLDARTPDTILGYNDHGAFD